MKILYDHQIFTNQRYGGISRYFFEMIKRFDEEINSCKVGMHLSNNAYYNDGINPNLSPFFSENHFLGKDRIIKFTNQNCSIKNINKREYDVFHPTYYDTYFLKSIRDKPFVVTFYDMIHEKLSDKFLDLKLDTQIFDNKKRLLENSAKVIAISETTKKDIIEIYGVDSEKVDVVYLGNSLVFSNENHTRIIKDDYILFVGNRGIYKNFNFFVTAIANLLLNNNLKIICAGGGDFTKQEINLLNFLNIQNKVLFKEIINDDVLANYYANALFFCFPSLYEGFGIPLLEAFACGCPVLLSNGGSLPEIGSDAALYFDPTDEDSLFTQANKLLSDEMLRKKLVDKGYTRLNQFSWDKTYQDHLKIYESIK
jgi:glycosyltransferase involved in cell wall biosynthesis